MIGTRLGLETGQYRLVHRLFDGLSSERECTPRDLDVIPGLQATVATGETSAFPSCGHTAALPLGCFVPILLQKSFSTGDQNLSRPLMRFSDKYVRNLVS